VAGRTVRWRTAGAGEPVVCVHGLAGSWRWWRAVAGRLAERHEVHLVDLPRFSLLARFAPGDAAAWLGRWLEAAALERPVLVGHSLGGLLAAQVAARRPDAVARLVLVSPAGIPTGRGLAGSVLSLAAALPTLAPRFVPVLSLDALRAGPESLALGGLYALATDLSGTLRRVDVPALVVWGRRDALLPPRLAERWGEALPRARVAVLAGAGHVPMVEAPAELARVLLDFLGEERVDEVGDRARRREVHGVGGAGDDGEAAAR